MDVEVRDVPEQERFEGTAGGELAGFLKYRVRPGGLLALVHTEVSDEHEGEGLASRLAAFALDSARERGLGVLPFCPFVKGYLERHPEYIDLVPEDRREGFGL